MYLSIMLCYNAIKTWRASCELHTEKSSTRLVTSVLHCRDNCMTHSNVSELRNPVRSLKSARSLRKLRGMQTCAFRKKYSTWSRVSGMVSDTKRHPFQEESRKRSPRIAHVISTHYKIDVTFMGDTFNAFNRHITSPLPWCFQLVRTGLDAKHSFDPGNSGGEEGTNVRRSRVYRLEDQRGQ